MEILSPEPLKEISIDLNSDPENDIESKPRSAKISKKKKSKPSSARRVGVKQGEIEAGDEIELGMKIIEKNDLTLGELRVKHASIKDETERVRRENAEGFYSLRHLIGQKGEQVLETLYFDHYPHLKQVRCFRRAVFAKPDFWFSVWFLYLTRFLGNPAKLDAPSSTDSVLNEIEDFDPKSPTEMTEVTDPNSIFYQTELHEEHSELTPRSRSRPTTQSSFATVDVITESEMGDFARSRSLPPTDYVKRNIQLAKTGDGLTIEERDRLEEILENDDDLEGKCKTNMITNRVARPNRASRQPWSGKVVWQAIQLWILTPFVIFIFSGPDFKQEDFQLAKINNTLENEYSRSTPLSLSTFPAICDSESDRLTEINSQLAIIADEDNALRVQSSNLMITDRPDSEMSNWSQLIPSNAISSMLQSLRDEVTIGQDALNDMHTKITAEKIQGQVHFYFKIKLKHIF